MFCINFGENLVEVTPSTLLFWGKDLFLEVIGKAIVAADI